ncbi:thioesterase family protein [Virgibacillus sp. SK37]|uniref:acyl-CoA thioesterase n=1 Tax=Virgibacillus sp. SK37 TaxID=403957 RepID=UPI000595679B|nr:thioesterase family protein [Virgibacillus sp. SK37]
MDIKVRFGETDTLGHINNTSYFIYMEEARIEFLAKMGIDIQKENYAFMLVSTKCDFIKQGYFGQVLGVTTEVSRMGTKSMTLTSTMREKESGDVIARGDAVLVYFNVNKQKTVPIPESFKEILSSKAVK